MEIPRFIKEVVWTFFPKKYPHMTQKSFRSSIGFMSVILLIAMLVSGLFFVPKLFGLRSVITEELDKFETFNIQGNVSTTNPVTIPRGDPIILVDTQGDQKLTREMFVVSKDRVQYRWFGVRSVPISQLKEVNTYRDQISGFMFIMFLMMLPSIALLFYIRAWFKYFLLVVVTATVMFIIFELTRYKLKWKQMANIAAHAMFPIMLIELIAAPFGTAFLLPIFRFIGLNVYAVTLAAFAVFVILGIVFTNLFKK